MAEQMEGMVRPYRVESVLFNSDGTVQVSFEETSGASPRARLIKTVEVVAEEVEHELEDLLDSIDGFIQAALVLYRDPPRRIQR